MDKETREVTRVRRMFIKEGHPLYSYCEEVTFASKNLYNKAVYYTRQVFTAFNKKDPAPNEQQQLIIDEINTRLPSIRKELSSNFEKRRQRLLKDPKASEKAKKKARESECKLPSDVGKGVKYIPYNLLYHLLRSTEEYKAMYSKSADDILADVATAWSNYSDKLDKWFKAGCPEKKKPGIPKYEKKDGHHKIYFRGLSKKGYEAKEIRLPRKGPVIPVPDDIDPFSIAGVRIAPKYGRYVVEILFSREVYPSPEEGDVPSRILGIDIGVNNFAALITNTPLKGVLIDGKGLKSYNRLFNKKKAKAWKDINPKERPGEPKREKPLRTDSKRLQRLHIKRSNVMDDFMHRASTYVVKYCQRHWLDTILIGSNPDWKRSSKMSKKENQSFVNIPHGRFVELLQYKAEEAGLRVILKEESYTSKSSFLDGDPIPVYGKKKAGSYKFSGKRGDNRKPKVLGVTIKFFHSKWPRGLYWSNDGTVLNSDIHGAANLIRKHYPDAFEEHGVEHVKLSPVRVYIRTVGDPKKYKAPLDPQSGTL